MRICLSDVNLNRAVPLGYRAPVAVDGLRSNLCLILSFLKFCGVKPSKSPPKKSSTDRSEFF
jgi:hypothetical protein